MIIVTVALTAFLCLAFASTRLIGVIGIAILFCIFPLLFVAFLVLAGIALFFINRYNKRKGFKYVHFTKLP